LEYLTYVVRVFAVIYDVRTNILLLLGKRIKLYWCTRPDRYGVRSKVRFVVGDGGDGGNGVGGRY